MHANVDTNKFLDDYEQDMDEIIAACRGDLRGAVRALMLINEQSEHKKAVEDHRQRLLH